MKAVLYKSKTDSVRTPPYIIEYVKKILDTQILFDPCKFNPKFNTSTCVDGLKIPWAVNNFVNPPYSRGVSKWLQKAQKEAALGKNSVLLLKETILSTHYFANYSKNVEIHFLPGKIKFIGYDRKAGFGSIFLVYRANSTKQTWKIATPN